ncbi:haloacid dehalogenase type II [Modicisalibacter tunisiensis]|uniref:(S)-2-haloacid dehalogenase n=1 Tax=Modicisalibacter tunisiensis TaxID=390637 RepID=A0ABS7WWJ6_9GAMM|nr:haloacid dehalogenase type II [Modicisalibacter tunisiensis]MBZ9539613.1 haloacid dehalogenase type II [Modicisalibacter tunisiensis]MBZ9566983.1 haloacid dehalogenase type II [Modicisalibacter tunisiensis]
MILVFDINETLLDTAVLSPLFEKLFGKAAVRGEWFLTLEETWMTATLAGRYLPFGLLAKSALRQTGLRHGIHIDDDHQRELTDMLAALPAHPDAAPALAELRARGFQLTALTNGTLETVQHQLAHAGLDTSFDVILSVDSVETYKPSQPAYQYVADHWQVSTRELVMIAAHGWDLIGAASAGCRTGFIARPGKVIDPQLFEPDWQADSLIALSRQLMEEISPNSGEAICKG